ncbi:MAG: PKD domain-containing protein [Bacillota bacterium]
MHRKKISSLIPLILAFTLMLAASYTWSVTPSTQYYCQTKYATLTVGGYNEEKILVVPDVPLPFPATVKWSIMVGKRNALSCPAEPYAKVYIIEQSGKAVEYLHVPYNKQNVGNITLKPGQFCRFKLFAGRYTSLFKKLAAKAIVECSYDVARITVEEEASVGRLILKAEGPSGIKDWTWALPDNRTLSGPVIKVNFPVGAVPMALSYTGRTKETFFFQLVVPDVLEAEPEVNPATGHEELLVTFDSKVVSHYRSSSICLWNFGDGSPITEGAAVKHTYKRKGLYNATLKIKNNYGPAMEKHWQIEVLPFNIVNQAAITPLEGIIPLKIKYQAKPQVLGSPSLLEYLWNFGDGQESKTAAGEHVYRRAGEYPITLSIRDTYHPRLDIEPWRVTVRALPPILTIKPECSVNKGIIPLTVDFKSNLTVRGDPVQLAYLWDFGDGDFSRDPSPSHTFNKPGNYAVSIIVKDELNGGAVNGIISIEAYPPNISSRSTLQPMSGPAPLTVYGDAQAQVEGAPVNLIYKWYVNNRLVYQGQYFKHTFYQTGTYAVSVEIIDNLPGHTGRTQQTWEVKVQ